MTDQTYIPTEEQVRDLYVSRWGQRDRGRAVGQFDRFIEAVKRDAWEEGAEYAAARPGYYPDENPYGYEEENDRRLQSIADGAANHDPEDVTP